MTDHQTDSQKARYEDAMAAAREAAETAGVTLEEWLSRTIVKNAVQSGLPVADGGSQEQMPEDQYQAIAQHLQQAQVAADAAGVPVAEWLTKAILETAGQSPGVGAAQPQPAAPGPDPTASSAAQPAYAEATGAWDPNNQPSADATFAEVPAEPAFPPTEPDPAFAPSAPPPAAPLQPAAPSHPQPDAAPLADSGDLYTPPPADPAFVPSAPPPKPTAAPAADYGDLYTPPPPDPEFALPTDVGNAYSPSAPAQPGNGQDLYAPPQFEAAPSGPLEGQSATAAEQGPAAQPQEVQPIYGGQQHAAPAPAEPAPPVQPIQEPAAGSPEPPAQAQQAFEQQAPAFEPPPAQPVPEFHAPENAAQPAGVAQQPSDPNMQPAAQASAVPQPDAGPAAASPVAEEAPALAGTGAQDLTSGGNSDFVPSPAPEEPAPEFVPTIGGEPEEPAAQPSSPMVSDTEPTSFAPVTPKVETADEPQNRLAQIIASTREEMAKRHQIPGAGPATSPPTPGNQLMVLPENTKKKAKRSGSSAWLTVTLLLLLALMAAAIWIIPNLKEFGILSMGPLDGAPDVRVAKAGKAVADGKLSNGTTLARMRKLGAVSGTTSAVPKNVVVKTARNPAEPARIGVRPGVPVASPAKYGAMADAAGFPKPAGKHVEWYKSAAKAGNVKAQVKLADLYLRGDGVKRNFKIAARLFRKAAFEGRNPQAQYALGVLYQRGIGVPKDLHTAVLWYERAARQGHVGAAYNAGEAYAKGIGIKRNLTKARRFFMRAAEAGDAESQFRLGVLYEKGMGVAKDVVVAFKWYALAGQRGYKKAGDAAERLIPAMSREQRDQAAELILEHNQRYGKPG